MPVPISPLARLPATAGLTPECAAVVAEDAEYHLRQVIHEAIALMHHAKRRKLSNADVANAVRLLEARVPYGAAAAESESTFEVDEEGASYTRAEPDVVLLDVAREKLPAYPRASTLRTHWLAVTLPEKGINCFQPLVAENPSDVALEPSRVASNVGAAGAAAAGAAAPGGLSTTSDAHGQVTVGNGGSGAGAMEHTLSKEMFAYYRKVVLTLRGADANALQRVFRSLGSDTGPQQLVPYFAQMIPAEVTYCIKRGREANSGPASSDPAKALPVFKALLPRLTALIVATEALLKNPHLYAEHYLHHLMPPILTCIVGRS